MDQLDLSVIILSYNTRDITDKCLAKLELAKNYCEKKFGNKVKIIVLDNASQDGSSQMIKQDYSGVKLIVSKENLGFSKGNNLVMKQVKTPFILLLNSDVYLEEQSLYKTLAYFRVNLNCDVLGAKLTYSDSRLQPSAGFLPDPLNIISWILGFGGFHPKQRAFFSKAHKVGWIMGAFFAFRRKVFDKTLGFDENLFMHMEEVEWCKRIWDLGFKIWYNPQIEAVHLHGASTKFDLFSSFLNELKGIKYYLKKHYSLLYYPVKIFLWLGLLLRIIVFSLLKKTDRARVYWKGLGVV